MVNKPVKTRRCYILYQTRRLIFRADHIDDLITSIKFFYDLRDTFRWMLQICVHTDDPISRTIVYPRNHRCLMAEIPRKADNLHIFVHSSQFFQNIQTVILTSVINEYKFMLPARVFYLLQDFIGFFIEFSQSFFFVVHGYDY